MPRKIEIDKIKTCVDYLKGVCGIYKITNPNGKIYIGQSRNIRVRMKSYLNITCKQQTILYSSLLKYGYENHFFEILEECELENLNNRERYWQDELEAVGPLGLNCYLEKADGKFRQASESTKNKLKVAQTGVNNSMYGRVGELHPNYGRKGKDNPLYGRVVSKETSNKISKALTGRKLSDEHVEKMREGMKGKYKGDKNPMFGKPKSMETVIKIIKTKTGIEVTPEQVIESRLKKTQRKKIEKNIIIKNTLTGELYYSLKEASEVVGVTAKNLSRKLNGSRRNTTILQRLN